MPPAATSSHPEPLLLLNRVGELLSTGGAPLPHLLTQLAAILGADAVTLWRDADGLVACDMCQQALGPDLRDWDETSRAARLAAFHPHLADLGAQAAFSIPFAMGQGQRGLLTVFGSPVAARRLASDPAFAQSLGGQFALFFERRSLAADAAMLREVHHRVKNNLQTVASVLRLQRRRLSEPAAVDALDDAIGRIRSIAHVHGLLAESAAHAAEVRSLAEGIARLLVDEIAGRRDVALTVEGPTMPVAPDHATALSLIVNELVQNALDHGLGDAAGRITIRTERLPGQSRLTILDSGGRGAQPPSAGRAGLGLTIVQLLAEEELGGRFALETRADGTRAEITFPAEGHA